MLSIHSPSREVGDALHLNSPSHLSHFDTHSAIREIRRSLSRSPSKGSELRQHSYPSLPTASGSTPFSSSPLSPSRRSSCDNFLQLSSVASPRSSRLPPSIRIHRPTMRRTAQTQSLLRTRTSPKSPSKRVLSESSDSGNSSPMPNRKRTSNEADRDLSLKLSQEFERQENSENHEMMDLPLKRHEKRRSGGFTSPVAPLSPMKRHDGPMNMEMDGLGSPSAKRRSLHGPHWDFSIFESENLQDEYMMGDGRSQDDNDWHRSGPSLAPPRFSTIPKRSSSLRKSTLQQRQSDRSGPSKLNQLSDFDLSAPASPASGGGMKQAMRMSLDNHTAPMPRDSPFSSQGSLLNASIHPVVSSHIRHASPHPHPHPLSRTMTQSSSTSSVQDDSPTHEPIHRSDRPRSHDFSKSLPIGATRPTAALVSGMDMDSSSPGSFATPSNYKSARPLPAAFMSTGLISKKNRNVEEPNAGLPKAHMPDTPCKKQSIVFPTEKKAAPSKACGTGKEARHSFGTPSTPYSSHHANVRPASFHISKGTGIFGNVHTSNHKNSRARRASFASIDGADKTSSQSPSHKGDSQSTDSDYPPTPTKHLPTSQSLVYSISPSPREGRVQPEDSFGSISIQGPRFTSSKLSPIRASPGSVDGDSDSVMDDSPFASLRPESPLMVVSAPSASFTRGRGLRNFHSPTPLSGQALAVPPLHSPRSGRTKLACLSPVSPRLDRLEKFSPHTPQDACFPPDPSGLSISGHGERVAFRPGSSSAHAVPATPTGPRDYFANFSNRPSLNLNAADVADVDVSLTSRFDRVELVGTGEFSQVYRVSQPPETSPYHSIYHVSTTRSSSRSSRSERVWAVKKSRHAYSGPRDRQRKIHEVDVLKSLVHCDHVLTFIDSWEEKNHLYIQTEFCEEGTLDVFLAQVGLKARLDDFRIWKILLELSLGLRHIHELGFIHLDLKPANVLITFEGVLKIADFGMATKWPAKAGIEGEGDREYIGPEILMGRYDQPADVFALGLIMLEIAGNVELPDNGASWQKLRNGDLSDVPGLTWSSDASYVLRDASGNPVLDNMVVVEDENTDMDDPDVTTTTRQPGLIDSKLDNIVRRGELVHPPAFMVDPQHDQALDRLVRWMISPEPRNRPVAVEILHTEGVRWAEIRRRAGATVFEGNWGPADEILAEDAEMIDV